MSVRLCWQSQSNRRVNLTQQVLSFLKVRFQILFQASGAHLNQDPLFRNRLIGMPMIPHHVDLIG